MLLDIEEEIEKCTQQIDYIKSTKRKMMDDDDELVTSYLLGKAVGRVELLNEIKETNNVKNITAESY